MKISILRLIAVFFVFVSTVSFADSYPGVAYYTSWVSFEHDISADASCSRAMGIYGGATYEFTGTLFQGCKIYAGNGSLMVSGTISKGFTCPAGGAITDGTTNICENAPECLIDQVRNSTTQMCQTLPTCSAGLQYINSSNTCELLPECTGTQSPLTTPCRFPNDKGLGVNCADGTTVYVPMVCPSTGSRWEDSFPPPKPMCSPLETDHSNCTPLLFQSFDDFASSHAIQYATAALALMSIPALAVSTEIATLAGGVAIEGRALWDGVFHNSAGEVVDVKVQGDIPKSVMGDALSDYIKQNPLSPYSTSFPEAYNAAALSSPIAVDPNAGDVHPVDSSIPLSSNQLWDAAKQLGTTLPIPYTQLAPYIVPERIPWLAEASPYITHDLQHQSAPANYSDWYRATSPLQTNSPYFQVSPNPLAAPEPTWLPSSPSSIIGLQPIPFSPVTPAPLTPAPSATTQPPAQYNPNPNGTDSPTSPLSSPSPTELIDPAAVEIPPVPPEIFPDTWKYFDFLPMSNPFSFDVHDFIPALPEPTCTYEIHRTFHVPLLGDKSFDLAPCVPLQPLRTVLAWVFSVLTLFTCFFVIFRSSL